MKKKCIAEFTTWSGKKVFEEIQREWAEAIAYAVQGQYYFTDNKSSFSINGADFQHVDIYEVQE